MESTPLFIDTIRFRLSTVPYGEFIPLVRELFPSMKKDYRDMKIFPDGSINGDLFHVFDNESFFLKVDGSSSASIELSQNRLKKYYGVTNEDEFFELKDFINFANRFGIINYCSRVDFTTDFFGEDLSWITQWFDRPRSVEKTYFFRSKGTTIKTNKLYIRFYNKHLEQVQKTRENLKDSPRAYRQMILSELYDKKDLKHWRFEAQLRGKNANAVLSVIDRGRKMKRYFKSLWSYLNIERAFSEKGKVPKDLKSFLFHHFQLDIGELYRIAEIHRGGNWKRDIAKFIDSSPEYNTFEEFIWRLKNSYIGIEKI